MDLQRRHGPCGSLASSIDIVVAINGKQRLSPKFCVPGRFFAEDQSGCSPFCVHARRPTKRPNPSCRRCSGISGGSEVCWCVREGGGSVCAGARSLVVQAGHPPPPRVANQKRKKRRKRLKGKKSLKSGDRRDDRKRLLRFYLCLSCEPRGQPSAAACGCSLSLKLKGRPRRVI